MISAVVTLADVVGVAIGTDTDVDTGATTVGVAAVALTSRALSESREERVQKLEK